MYQSYDDRPWRGDQRASGSVLSGSMPRSRTALAAFDRGQRAAASQRDHRRRGDVGRIDLEQRAQVLARVAPPEAVRAERQVMRRQPARDHVRAAPSSSRWRRRSGRRRTGRIVATYGTRGRLGVRVEPVPALGLEGVAAQQRERRGAVDLGGDAELLGQEVAGGEDLLEDRARADQPGRVRVAAEVRGGGEAVDAAQDLPRRSGPRAGPAAA